MVEPDEEALQIVFAGLLDLAAFDPHVIDDEFLGCDQLVDVEMQGSDIGREILASLLETHEHAGLAEARRAVDQEGHAEQRLAATRAADDQRRPSARKASEGDLVEAG